MKALESIRTRLAGVLRWLGRVRRCEVDGVPLRFKGRTLHDAMTENGIDPGGDCRTGRCGRCRVECQAGDFRLLAPAGWVGGGQILACQVSPGSSMKSRRMAAPR